MPVDPQYADLYPAFTKEDLHEMSLKFVEDVISNKINI